MVVMGWTRNSWLRVFAVAVTLLVLVPALGAAPAPRRGGQLVVALESEPPNLDMHWSALNFIRYIAYHVNDQLFTLNEKFEPIPLLAESHRVSGDGKTYTITLRRGIKFHNGQDLTADDVVASLQRWMRRSTMGQAMAFNVTEIRAADSRTVQIALKQPMGFVPGALAAFRQGAAIYPKSAIEKAGARDPVTDYIGTGPYRFVEWRRGQHVLLRRYDGYQSRSEPANGYGGRREAYFDEIRFVFVREPSVRAVGVQAGDFHFAWPVSTDDYSRLQANPNIETFLSAPRMFQVLLNKRSPLMSNLQLRRAVQAAVDAREIMTGVFGDQRFWRLDPGIMWKETAWWSDAGKELYNMANPERARQLLSEAGYRGEPIRMIVSAPERIHLTGSQILKRQLERAGMTVQEIPMDVNTHRDTAQNPARWELYTMDSTYREHPILHIHWRVDYGFWENQEKELLMQRLLTVQNPGVAKSIWERVQLLYYQDVAMVKAGDYFDLVAMQKRVQNYKNMPEPFFWNVWFDR
jgi:peptide/nickel transport system substrate-binding protein